MQTLAPYVISENWLAHDNQVKHYQWEHRKLTLLHYLIRLTFLGFILCCGGIWWERILHSISMKYAFVVPTYALFFLYFFSIFLLNEFLSTPFYFWHYQVEKRHQLTRQTTSHFLIDQLKVWGIAALLIWILLSVCYLFLQLSPSMWWIWFVTFLSFFLVLLAELFPIVLIPLFYPIAPLESGDLKNRLFALCQRKKIQIKEIYRLSLSSKTEKGNAAFAGLGKAKCILIGDTLLKTMTADEIEAIFTHELGHQVYQDTLSGVLLGGGQLFLCFFIAARLMGSQWDPLHHLFALGHLFLGAEYIMQDFHFFDLNLLSLTQSK